MLTNLSFETAGASPGAAAAWTWTRVVPFEFESFETAAGGISRFEGFELGWGVDSFESSLTPPSNATAFVFGSLGGQPTPFETFERGWRLPMSHAVVRSTNADPFALTDGETFIFSASDGTNLGNGNAASILGSVGTTFTLGGFENLTTDLVGATLTIVNAANPGNNTSITISDVPSPSTIVIVNPSGVYPDANSGELGWFINPATFSLTVIFHTAKFLAIGAATAREVVLAINEAIGADAPVVASADTFGHVSLETNATGGPSYESPGTSIAIGFGTANTALGFTSGTTHGGVDLTHPGNEIFALVWGSGEAASFALRLQGSEATIVSQVGSLTTVGGLEGMTPALVGTSFVLSGAATSGNNVAAEIVEVLSPSSIQITNPLGAFPDANSGELAWYLDLGAVDLPQPVEAFEAGWPSNEVYYRTFTAAPSQAAAFAVSLVPPSGEPFDNFEQGWKQNEAYVFAFTAASGTTATIASKVGSTVTLTGLAGLVPGFTYEDFTIAGAANSGNNGSTFPVVAVLSLSSLEIMNAAGVFPEANSGALSWGVTMLARSSFNQGGSEVLFESFNVAKADQPITADETSSTFTAVAHGFANGDRVTLYAGATPSGVAGVLPTGINPLLTWYVVGAATNTFQISQTNSGSGSAIPFSDNGNGPIFVKADPTQLWTLTDVGV